MTTEAISFSAALLIGLLGGAHCMGMCGGISAAFGLNTQGTAIHRLIKNISFNLGRIASYVLIGFLLGYLSALFSNYSPMIGMILRLVAGIFIILMGLYIADWSRAITRIEKPGQFIWKYIQPLTKPFIPTDTAGKALMLGMLWGWLPCGLVYSTLVLALSSGDSFEAAYIMLGFGLGTLPAMLATGILATQLKAFVQSKITRNLAAIMMILMGIWVLWGNSQHLLGHGDHGSHANHGEHSVHEHHSEHSGHSNHQHNDAQPEKAQNDKAMPTEHHNHHNHHDHMNHEETPKPQNQPDHNQMNHDHMNHSKMSH